MIRTWESQRSSGTRVHSEDPDWCHQLNLVLPTYLKLPQIHVILLIVNFHNLGPFLAFSKNRITFRLRCPQPLLLPYDLCELLLDNSIGLDL